MKIKRLVSIILSITIIMSIVGVSPYAVHADNTTNVKLTSNTVKGFTRQIEDISFLNVPNNYKQGGGLSDFGFYMLFRSSSKGNTGLTSSQRKQFNQKYKDKYSMYVTQKTVDSTVSKYFGSKVKVKHPISSTPYYQYDSKLKVYCYNGFGFTDPAPIPVPISCTQSGSTYKLSLYFYQMTTMDGSNCFFPDQEDKIYSNVTALKSNIKSAPKYTITFYKKGSLQYITEIKKSLPTKDTTLNSLDIVFNQATEDDVVPLKYTQGDNLSWAINTLCNYAKISKKPSNVPSEYKPDYIRFISASNIEKCAKQYFGSTVKINHTKTKGYNAKFNGYFLDTYSGHGSIDTEYIVHMQSKSSNTKTMLVSPIFIHRFRGGSYLDPSLYSYTTQFSSKEYDTYDSVVKATANLPKYKIVFSNSKTPFIKSFEKVPANATISLTSSEKVINHVENMRTLWTNQATNSINANKQVFDIANKLLFGENILSILGTALGSSTAGFTTLPKALMGDLDLWIVVSTQILANTKCTLSDEYAKQLIKLYDDNEKITHYNVAKKIFDLARDMDIEGMVGRELMRPIINKYADLNNNSQVASELAQNFYSSAGSTVASYFGNYVGVKSAVQALDISQNGVALRNLIIDSSPAGAIQARLQSDYTKLWKQLTV